MKRSGREQPARKRNNEKETQNIQEHSLVAILIDSMLFRGLLLMICAGTLWGISGCDAGSDPNADTEQETETVGDAGAPDSGVTEPEDSDPNSIGDGNPRFDPIVKAIETELAGYKAEGAAVAIIEGGEVIFARGFGAKHPDEPEPVMTETLFRIGSVTKMMTAVAVLQQVEVGNAALDAPITEYLPTLAFTLNDGWASSITLEHLLTHTSGIVDHLELDNRTSAFEYLIEEFPSWAYLMVPPGTFYNYSNPGYSYAGLVVEVLDDTPYDRYMVENVFSPLGMNRTFFSKDDVLDDGDYSFGTVSNGEAGETAVMGPKSYDVPWGYPAGFAWSSVLDLAKFVSFLRDGEQNVLSNELREEMLAPKVNTMQLFDYFHYGYGIVDRRGLMLPSGWYDLKILWHNGGIPGYSTDLYYIPELDIGFVALVNASGVYLNESVATAISSLCDLPAPGEMPHFELTVEMLDSYEGRYIDPFGIGEIEIARKDDTLEIAIPNFDDQGLAYEHTLLPSSPDNFAFVVEGDAISITFIFESTDDENPRWLRTRYAVAERADEADSAASESATER